MKIKSIRSKKQFGEVLESIKSYMNKEGIEVYEYFVGIQGESDMTLKELKEELSDSIQPALFNNADQYKVVCEMLGVTQQEIKGEEKPKTTEEKPVEKPKSDKKDDKNKGNDTKKDDTKDGKLDKEVVKLIGYRYTRPQFPETLTDIIEDVNTLERFDGDVADLVNFNLGDIFIATYFPKYDNGVFVDPDNVMEKNYKDLLKEQGLTHFPNDLDISQIIDVDVDHKTMVYNSIYTFIPYAVSIRDKWAKVDELLKCRVNQFGHDYAIYVAKN